MTTGRDEPKRLSSAGEPDVQSSVEFPLESDQAVLPGDLSGIAHGENILNLLPAPEHAEALRVLEALIFASAEPIDEAGLARRMDPDCNVPALLDELGRLYARRGVNLVKRGKGWAFRTAPDLAHLLVRHAVEQRRLSRAALETLAIIAYHQPVTRAEIEEIRGVATSKGTLDMLLELDWVRMRGRRRSPGRPVTYGTTELFLDQFSLETLRDLPGLNELKGAGLLDSQVPADFVVPEPRGLDGLEPDEDPLDDEDFFDGDETDGDTDGTLDETDETDDLSSEAGDDDTGRG